MVQNRPPVVRAVPSSDFPGKKTNSLLELGVGRGFNRGDERQ